MVKKIVIIGPESTGKSSLCEQLAQHYHTEWCPEFAREYLLTHGTDYSFNDLLTVAMGQGALENEYLKMVEGQWSGTADGRWVKNKSMLTAPHPPALFIDTDMYVMKVWCEYVFQKCHQFILDEIVTRKCDLYLFCNIDLPWIKDELREYPDEKPRVELYHIYKDLLINQDTPWVDISGGYDQRFSKAVEAVDRLLR